MKREAGTPRRKAEAEGQGEKNDRKKGRESKRAVEGKGTGGKEGQRYLAA